MLLAECYLGKLKKNSLKPFSGEEKPYKAYEILSESTSQANKYKFALTCIKLNKLAEAERTLLGKIRRSSSIEERISNVPNGAAGLYLLGLVYELQSKSVKDAALYYSKCLELDPTMWCAYEKLSKIN